MTTAGRMTDWLFIGCLLLIAGGAVCFTGMTGAMLAAGVRSAVAHADTAIEIESGQRLTQQQKHQHDNTERHGPTLTSGGPADK